MQYITLVSDSYEKAVEEAKRKYGSSLRIISRKEYTSGGGIFTRKRRKCEITFYLVEEKPAKEEKKKNVTRQDLAEFEQEARSNAIPRKARQADFEFIIELPPPKFAFGDAKFRLICEGRAMKAHPLRTESALRVILFP